MKYIVYGQQGCNFCARAQNLLTVEGKPYKYIDILDNPEDRHWIVEVEEHKTVPQIYVENARGVTEYIGGFEELQDHLMEND